MIRTVVDYAGVSIGDRILHQYAPNRMNNNMAVKRKTRKLGFLLPNQPGFFQDEIMRGINTVREECWDQDIEINVVKCDGRKPVEFVEAIDHMVADGGCGFAICAQNSKYLVKEINWLYGQGIPVITVNSDIPDSKRRCFVGEDAVKSGQIAAEVIYKYQKSSKAILVIAGNPEFTAHQNRVQGFMEYMQRHGVSKGRCKIIHTYEREELIGAKVKETLIGYPNIQSVYMAVKSASAYEKAIKELNLTYKPFVVSHDVDEVTLSLMRQELIDFTIYQDLFSQGYLSLHMLIDYLLYGKQIKNVDSKLMNHIISAACVN